MEWSPQQSAALSAVNDWLRRKSSQVFRLFGYAGTGKSTLAKHLAEGVDGDVLYAAYTGKAAHVMRQKGCEGASTLHSLIYNPVEKGRRRLQMLRARAEELPNDADAQRELQEEIDRVSRPSFVLNTDSDLRDAALLIVDEVSMVNTQLGEDLLMFGVPVLVLGDPAQLPPVGGGGFFTAQSPNVLLTEIHRQALDNPIIRLATGIRAGGNPPPGNYGSSRVVRRPDFNPAEILSYDQLLVGRNDTRHAANRRVRAMKGLVGSELPLAGDKLVCLRNNREAGILNGSLWDVAEARMRPGEAEVFLRLRSLDGTSWGDYLGPAHTHFFRGRESELVYLERDERIAADDFDFGYALTVHKSQGSQWETVLIMDESNCFSGDDQWRWLYTGVTRASERVTLVVA